MIRLDSLFLPDGLIWVDEFMWQPVSGSTDRALDGSEITNAAALNGGRPITLESGAGLKRLDVEALQALASQADGSFLLVLRDIPYQVRFRHEEVPAFSATPVFPLARPEPTDYYTVTIKLKTL
jgi:hypothetical protein